MAVCCWRDFAQLVEQARVLYGDDGLRGEVLDQRDLFVGESTHLLAKNADRADQFIILEHRDAHDRPIIAQFNRSEPVRIVRSMCRNVVDLDHLFRGGSTPEGGVRRRPEAELASACFGICGRRVVQCNGPKRISFAEPKRAEFGLTNASCVLQHGIEHRLQLAGRARDHLQDLGGRSLLLQRFAQLVEQPRVLDGDDGLGGEVRQQLDLSVAKGPHLLAGEIRWLR